MCHLRIAAAVATCMVVAGAGPAAAAGASTCAKTASVRDGTVLKLAGGGSAKSLSRGPYYVTTGRVATLRFGAATFRVAADTIFDLACSGAAGGPADKPSLNVEMGSASVRTGGRSSFGTLSSDEMLLDPYAGKKMKMKLTRTPLGDPTIEQAVAQGPSAMRLGTTVARQIGGAGGFLNITPYIGSAHSTNGLCHQAHGATTVTTAFEGSYPQGSVTYSGLASFSPR